MVRSSRLMRRSAAWSTFMEIVESGRLLRESLKARLAQPTHASIETGVVLSVGRQPCRNRLAQPITRTRLIFVSLIRVHGLNRAVLHAPHPALHTAVRSPAR